MEHRTVRRLKPRTIVLLLAGLLLLLTAGGVFWYATRSKGPLPPETRSNLTFSPFVLSENTAEYSASGYKLSTAEDGVQILTYTLQAKGTKIPVSVYPQPPQFAEIPEYKERFLTNVAKQYATVQTANGTIYLGRMSKQDDKQLGVMVERGLLVLMNPERELDQPAWRSIGDRLELQRVID